MKVIAVLYNNDIKEVNAFKADHHLYACIQLPRDKKDLPELLPNGKTTSWLIKRWQKAK